MEREYKRSRRCKNDKNSAEKLFIKSLRRSICSMLLCTVCLISSTWAWFVASAESQMTVIRLGNATQMTAKLTMTAERSLYSLRRTPIQRGENGEFMVPAGSYVITVEPVSGSAPMYCLIDIETAGVSEERIEWMIEEFNEDMEEEWIPIYATDSNAILVLEDDEQLEEYEAELEEQEDFEYEVLTIPVVKDDIYRVIWEPEEERTFVLNLEEDAIVSFYVDWLTDAAAEEEYPELDEMKGWNYVVIFPNREASPSDALAETTTAEVPTVESSTASESSTAATEGSIESVQSTQSTESTTGSAGTETQRSEAASESASAEAVGTEAVTSATTATEESISGAETTSGIPEGALATATSTENSTQETQGSEESEAVITIDAYVITEEPEESNEESDESKEIKIDPEDSTETIESLGN